ncbi:MAG: winged helix-turn-helix transcriptional regulator [Thermoplasmata archaeon]|nr:MAG: winged helix-turn-helix transcriptional regulator [Thermoplasmata archaeon]
MKNNKSQLDYFNKEDELLVYLSSYNNNYSDDYVVPYAVTQKGICKNINCSQGHVSRLLKKLIDEGYGIQMTRKIERKRRKQKAYFLTDKGQELALKIKKSKSKKK